MALAGEKKKEYMREYMRRKRASNSNKIDVLPILATLLYSFAKYNIAEKDTKEISPNILAKLYDVKTDTNWSNLHTINVKSIANFLNKEKYLSITEYQISNRLNRLENKGLIHKAGRLYTSTNNKCAKTDKKYGKFINLYQIHKDIEKLIDKEYEGIGWKYVTYLYKTTMSKKEKKIANIVKTFPQLVDKYTNEYTHYLETQENGKVRYIRYFTSLCLTKNPDNHEDRPLERYYELDKLYGFEHLDKYDAYKDRYVEYDISGMSLRLTKNLINTLQGKPPLSKNIDTYEEIYKDMECTKPIDNFHDSEERKLLKVEVQSLFQKPNAVKSKTVIYRNSRNIDINSYTKITKNDLKTITIVDRGRRIEEVFGISYTKFLYELKNALYRFCKIYTNQRLMLLGNYYFVEGIVYGEMMEYFKSKGIKVFNVYDGFYGLADEFTEKLLYEAYEYGIRQLITILTEKYIYNNFVKTYDYSKQKHYITSYK